METSVQLKFPGPQAQKHARIVMRKWIALSTIHNAYNNSQGVTFKTDTFTIDPPVNRRSQELNRIKVTGTVQFNRLYPDTLSDYW